MKYFLKNKKGFTLTELMVVVVILGILVAIAVPVYNNLSGGAKDSAHQANIRTLESVVLQIAINSGVDQKDININVTVDDTTKTATAAIKAPAKIAEGADAVTISEYIAKWPLNPKDDTLSYYVAGGLVKAEASDGEGSK